MRREHPPAHHEFGAAGDRGVVEAVERVSAEPDAGFGGQRRPLGPRLARGSAVFGIGLLIGATLHCLAATNPLGTDGHDSSGAGGSASVAGSREAPGGDSGEGGCEPQPTGWHGDIPLLHNDAACALWTHVAATAAYEGHLAAVRLTPPAYPFLVTQIQYELLGEENACDNGVAHRIELSSGWGVMPPATPSQILAIHETPSSERVRVVEKELAQPIVLVSGMHLFVAVELVADSSCIAACARVHDTGRDYLSTTAHEPHGWIPIASALSSVHLRIGANGHAL